MKTTIRDGGKAWTWEVHHGPHLGARCHVDGDLLYIGLWQVPACYVQALPPTEQPHARVWFPLHAGLELHGAIRLGTEPSNRGAIRTNWDRSKISTDAHAAILDRAVGVARAVADHLLRSKVEAAE